MQHEMQYAAIIHEMQHAAYRTRPRRNLRAMGDMPRMTRIAEQRRNTQRTSYHVAGRARAVRRTPFSRAGSSAKSTNAMPLRRPLLEPRLELNPQGENMLGYSITGAGDLGSYARCVGDLNFESAGAFAASAEAASATPTIRTSATSQPLRSKKARICASVTS